MQVGTVTGSRTQDAGVRIDAVVYPACLCGVAWTAHLPVVPVDAASARCTGYRPRTPVVNYGTRAYSPRPSLAWWRKVLCRWAWSAEVRLQHWRERTDGIGGQ